MSRPAKAILSLFLGVGSVGAASAGLTLIVEYEPYGVPEHRRAEYERRIAQLEQRALRIEQSPDQPAPRAVIERAHHEFGMLDPHTTASHTFAIHNEGNAPLQLHVRETSCKCTTGQLQKDMLAAGESTTVTLTWNTGYQADHYEQTAILTTNDPNRPTIELKVSGQVRAKLIAPQNVQLPDSDPGELVESSFVLYSQLWEDFAVLDAEAELNGLQWSVEPVVLGERGALPEAGLFDAEAKSAWRVHLWVLPETSGAYEGDLTLRIAPVRGGASVERTVRVAGKVHSLISFIHPDLRRSEGLDLGTVVSDEAHQFQLVVRERSGENRRLAVLDVEPDVVTADLQPIASRPGNHRLTLIIPSGCPTTRFHLDSQHGYVEVGDPDDPGFSNWMPIRGAVVQIMD